MRKYEFYEWNYMKELWKYDEEFNKEITRFQETFLSLLPYSYLDSNILSQLLVLHPKQELVNIQSKHISILM